MLYVETFCTVCGDTLCCMWRHSVLYVETFCVVCGDILYCTWRHFVLYVEVLYMETFCAVCGGAVCRDIVCCMWSRRHFVLYVETLCAVCGGAVCGGAVCGDILCCMWRCCMWRCCMWIHFVLYVEVLYVETFCAVCGRPAGNVPKQQCPAGPDHEVSGGLPGVQASHLPQVGWVWFGFGILNTLLTQVSM